MVNSADFTKRLEKILQYYGLTATAFSEEIDFNRSTISHLLSGRNKPSLEFVMKVVKHFPEVELYWLLNGKGSFPAQKLDLDNQASDWNEPTTHNSTTKTTKSDADSSKNAVQIAQNIDRIVIFYSDGTFKEYRP